MSLVSQQTMVLTQNPPLLVVFIVASFRTWYCANQASPVQVAVNAAVTSTARGQCFVDEPRQLAYVADGASRFWAIDISDALNPAVADSIVVGGGGDEIVAAAAIGNTIYVTDIADNDVYVIDATDPTNLIQINEFQTDLFPVPQRTPVAIASKGNYLYAINYAQGSPPSEPSLLNVMNATNPLSVTQTATLDWGVPANDQTLFPDRYGSVFIVGNTLYALTAGVLHIVDIQDPANPRSISDTDISPTAYAMVLNQSATRAFILDQTNDGEGLGRLRWYNITNKANPVQLDTQQFPFAFCAQVARGPGPNTFYVTGFSGASQTTLFVYRVVSDVIGMEIAQSAPIAAIANGTAIAALPSYDIPNLRV